MDRLRSPIGAYFERLDDDDPVGAASLFSVDATYIRPDTDARGMPTGEMQILRGRDEIEQSFVVRGKRPYRHTVRASLRVDDTEFVEGRIINPPGSLSTAFLATAKLDAESRIVRYFATGTTMSADGLAELDR